MCLTLWTAPCLRAGTVCSDSLPHRLLRGILGLLASSVLEAVHLFRHAAVCRTTDHNKCFKLQSVSIYETWQSGCIWSQKCKDAARWSCDSTELGFDDIVGTDEDIKVCFYDVQMMTSPAEPEEGYWRPGDAKCPEGPERNTVSSLFTILFSTIQTLKYEAEGKRVLVFN